LFIEQYLLVILQFSLLLLPGLPLLSHLLFHVSLFFLELQLLLQQGFAFLVFEESAHLLKALRDYWLLIQVDVGLGHVEHSVHIVVVVEIDLRS
jgi:small-conductance mechanosensitive channel